MYEISPNHLFIHGRTNKQAHIAMEKRQLEEQKRAESAQIEAQRAREVYNETKFRQQIRENSQELRELESKLRTAYVSKALAAQKQEKKALELAESIERRKELEQLEQSRLEHIQQLKADELARRERMRKHHEDLKEQIVSAHKEHQKLFEEFLREKFYLDEISKRVKEELMAESRKRLERKEQTRKEMEAFDTIKKEMQRLHDITLDEENQRILEYCEQRDKKIQADEQRRVELEENRQILNKKMADELQELEVRVVKSSFY